MLGWSSMGDGILSGAVRRWPPKRCRIICVGEPNATPFGRAHAPSSSQGLRVLAVVAPVGELALRPFFGRPTR